MDFSPLTVIKSGKDKGVFLCPLLTKSRFLNGLFAASFQVFLTICTVGHWKEVSTENGSEHISSWWTESLSSKQPDLRDKVKDKWWVKKLLCSHQLFDPWSQADFINTADSQDYHYQAVKWSDGNQTGLIILSNMLKINLISLYWILNLFRRYWTAGTSSKMERWKGAQTFTFRLLCCRLNHFSVRLFFHLESSQMYRSWFWHFSFSSTETYYHLWLPFLPKASLNLSEVALS